MKTMQDWLDAYAVSHQNKTNKAIHFICVPLIVFSVVGLFMSIQRNVEVPHEEYLLMGLRIGQ